MYKDSIVYEMEQKPLNQLINIFTQTTTASATSNSLTSENNNNSKKQDKKRSIILPWTKGI